MNSLSYKVVIVLGYFEMGGAERQAIYLAEYLHHHPDTQVTVVGLRKPGKVSQLLLEKNISWEYIPLELSHRRIAISKNCFRLVKYFWSLRPDAIIPFTYWPNILCGLTWRLTTAKICIWNQRDEGRGVRSSRLEKLALCNVSNIISNSLEGKLFLEKSFNILSKEVKIIRNGVALGTPKKGVSWWYKYLTVKPDTFVVAMVANLHIHKDHATLLRAWKLFTDQVTSKNVVLLLAGRLDDQYTHLKTLAQELHIYDSLRFLGPIQDISGLLRVTDLVVFSSKKEGCPNSVLEAMQAEKPVVATSITGTREALGEEYPFLAEPNNVNAFSQKIYFFYRNPAMAKEVGYRNKNYVKENFSIANMQESYLSLIEGKILA